jgi:vacuolar-type H+-ATPase subunit H
VEPIESVAATSGRWAKFDKALEGLSAERKAEVQRLISNLGLTPDDPAVIAAALLGHLAKVGEDIPKEIYLAGEAASDQIFEASKQTRDALKSIIGSLMQLTPSLKKGLAEEFREDAHQIIRDGLDKLSEGAGKAAKIAHEEAISQAQKHFDQEAKRILGEMERRVPNSESVAFWKGVAYTALGFAAILVAAMGYMLMGAK